MEIRILAFINIIAFGFIVSQAMFYMLAMSRVSKQLTIGSYVEVRQLLDANLQITLRFIYYFTLITTTLLTLFTSMWVSGILFITSAVALVALLLDVVLAVAGDIPLNKIINRWTPQNYPDDWQQVRQKWFRIYHVRQAFAIIGFISLLTGIFYGI